MNTANSKPVSHQHFIDWMKAVGMLLIIIGHVVGGGDALFNAVSAPIYSKQLGVALFLFVAGWGLGNRRRPRAQEAWNRLFPLMLYGAACAVLMSIVTWIQISDLAESNYLPLFFGVNVFLNYFPANPTTWYIGMYLHLILLWWWLVPDRVPLIAMLLAVLLEVLLRAWFLSIERPYTGYMLVSNWFSVFLLGYALRARCDTPAPGKAILLLALWIAALGLWQMGATPLSFDSSFPTRLPEGSALPLIAVSALVSLVYVANTLLAFATFRRLPAPWPVRMFARNTLLIFILHMPLIYALAPMMPELDGQVWLRKLLLIVAITISLTMCSEFVQRLVPVNRVRDALGASLSLRSP